MNICALYNPYKLHDLHSHKLCNIDDLEPDHRKVQSKSDKSGPPFSKASSKIFISFQDFILNVFDDLIDNKGKRYDI